MLLKNWRSQLLVSLQFFLAAVMVITISVEAFPVISLFVSGGGILLWGWAIFTMKLSRISMRPEVSTNAQLLTRGPFRLIRHPMYAGLALFLLGGVFAPFLWWRLVIWLLLCAVLLGKSRIEESLLLAQFPEYGEYQRRTKRFVPFLF
ncbi:MAG: isoprenylcysteine carboxylmethyltransferase family protein [Rhodopirellula sp.]|nr:isoprenylcysteine carboxylmethyltransferase family protein [Rhodopirellula sp.]